MRTLILRSLAALALAAAATCAEEPADILTLKDGRVLTGVYDAESETLDMGMAKVPVRAEDIKWRDKAKQAPKTEAPAKAEAKAADQPKPARADPSEIEAAIAANEAAQAEATKLEGAAAKIRSEAGAALVSRLSEVAKGMDLRSVKYNMPPDPRASDRDFYQRISSLNSRLDAMRRALFAAEVSAYVESSKHAVLLRKAYGASLARRPEDSAEIVRFFQDAQMRALHSETRNGYELIDQSPRAADVILEIKKREAQIAAGPQPPQQSQRPPRAAVRR
jgi:hypothetical protein